jgi:Zn-dependent protease
MEQLLWQISTLAIPAIVAITLHEAAHGYAALRFGDDTAARAGRLSLNPLRHVDPFGTLLLPALLLLSNAPFLFGYAKPVPVNFGRLRNFRRDMVLVAAAGPAMNLFLALLSAVLYHGLDWFQGPVQIWLALNLENSIWINVLLAVFNMLPIPPLDGGRVAVGILPRPLALPLARLERVGIFIVIGLFLFAPWLGVPLGRWLIVTPTLWIQSLIIAAAGIG